MIGRIKFYKKLSSLDTSEYKYVGYSLYRVGDAEESYRFEKYEIPDKGIKYIKTDEGILAGQILGIDEAYVEDVLDVYVDFESDMEYIREMYDYLPDYESFCDYFDRNKLKCIAFNKTDNLKEIVFKNIKEYFDNDSNNVLMIKHSK